VVADETLEVMWWWYVWRGSLARATFDTSTINGRGRGHVNHASYDGRHGNYESWCEPPFNQCQTD
jgi:hypothetical protein